MDRQLYGNERLCAIIPEIAEKLARTFSQTSSNENSENFLIQKCNRTEIDFHSDNSESYNTSFTKEEL